jgi:hypothetical protein
MPNPLIKIKRISNGVYQEVVNKKEGCWFLDFHDSQTIYYHESGYGFLYANRFEIVD